MKPAFVLQGHQDRVTVLAVSTDGRRAVSLSADGTLVVWDLAQHRALQACQTGHHSVIALSPDGSHAALAHGSFPFVEVWDLQSGTRRWKVQSSMDRVKALAFSPDGRMVLCAGRRYGDNSEQPLEVRDSHGGGLIRTIPVKCPDNLTSLAVTPDGGRLVTGSDGGAVHVLDLDTGQRVGGVLRHGPHVAVHDLRITADGSRVVSRAGQSEITDWGLEKHVMVERMFGGKADVSDFSDGFKGLILWDLNQGKRIRRLARGCRSMDVSQDGSLAITGEHGGAVNIWYLHQGERKLTVQAHEGGVPPVAMTPSRDLALTGGADGTVKVWDVSRGLSGEPGDAGQGESD